MSDSEKDRDDDRFNETLKRMLKTPPKPHDKAVKGKSEAKPNHLTKKKPAK